MAPVADAPSFASRFSPWPRRDSYHSEEDADDEQSESFETCDTPLGGGTRKRRESDPTRFVALKRALLEQEHHTGLSPRMAAAQFFPRSPTAGAAGAAGAMPVTLPAKPGNVFFLDADDAVETCCGDPDAESVARQDAVASLKATVEARILQSARDAGVQPSSQAVQRLVVMASNAALQLERAMFDMHGTPASAFYQDNVARTCADIASCTDQELLNILQV